MAHIYCNFCTNVWLCITRTANLNEKINVQQLHTSFYSPTFHWVGENYRLVTTELFSMNKKLQLLFLNRSHWFNFFYAKITVIKIMIFFFNNAIQRYDIGFVASIYPSFNIQNRIMTQRWLDAVMRVSWRWGYFHTQQPFLGHGASRCGNRLQNPFLKRGSHATPMAPTGARTELSWRAAHSPERPPQGPALPSPLAELQETAFRWRSSRHFLQFSAFFLWTGGLPRPPPR